MRSAVILGVVYGMVFSTFGQGLVSFNNNLLGEPPDRKVRYPDGSPVTGTNFLAQLYWSTNGGATLTAVTAAPALMRPGGNPPQGTWAAGNRTLPNGVGGVGTTIHLQVRVWDIFGGTTFEQAQASGGFWGESAVFTYTQRLSTPAAVSDVWMHNFVGFSISNPDAPSLEVRANGGSVDVLFDGIHNVEASSDLRSWIPFGQRSSPFTDNSAATLPARFYRINDGGIYSRNAVGFYRVGLCSGYSLVANQFNRPGNLVREIFPSPPNNSRAYKFNPSAAVFDSLTFIQGLGWDDGGGGTIDMTLHPGDGIFFYSPAAFTQTFLGEVPMSVLRRPIPPGFSILSAPLPQSGPLNLLPPSGLGFPIDNGDVVYQWACGRTTYISNEFVTGHGWVGDSEGEQPILSIGEAFFLFNAGGTDRVWERNFRVGP